MEIPWSSIGIVIGGLWGLYYGATADWLHKPLRLFRRRHSSDLPSEKP